MRNQEEKTAEGSERARDRRPDGLRRWTRSSAERIPPTAVRPARTPKRSGRSRMQTVDVRRIPRTRIRRRAPQPLGPRRRTVCPDSTPPEPLGWHWAFDLTVGRPPNHEWARADLLRRNDLHGAQLHNGAPHRCVATPRGMGDPPTRCEIDLALFASVTGERAQRKTHAMMAA